MKKILTIIIVIVALQLGVVSITSASGGSYHKVHYGETLHSIARYYHADPYYIAEVNGLYNPDHIYAGQVLYIPTSFYGNDYNSGYNQNKSYHRVHYGETLYSIGRKYNVHPNHLADANNLYNPNYIYAGQKLYIPSGSNYPWKSGYGYYDRNQYGRHGGYNHGYNNYGYDYTGYYYQDGGKRYSYTCGYYHNCW